MKAIPTCRSAPDTGMILVNFDLAAIDLDAEAAGTHLDLWAPDLDHHKIPGDTVRSAAPFRTATVGGLGEAGQSAAIWEDVMFALLGASGVAGVALAFL